MKNYEYNWATAEIMKMYLKNSRAQEARRARAETGVSIDTQEAPTTNPGFVTANNAAGSHSGVGSDSELSSGNE